MDGVSLSHVTILKMLLCNVSIIPIPVSRHKAITFISDSTVAKITMVYILLRMNEFVSDGALRLVGSSYSYRGRLEIYYNGVWGTVCDDGFSGTDARVACRQLGYSGYSRYGNVRTLG